LRSISGWLLVVAAVMTYLHVAHGQAPGAALGVGLLAGTFAAASLGLTFSVVRTLRERVRWRVGLAGAQPMDGRQVALVGHITPLKGALVAPLDGAPCVAYNYEIFEDRGAGRQRHRATYYKGTGLAPATIATPAGSFRLLAVPEFEGETGRITGEAGLARVAHYLRTTTFAPRKTSARELEQRWSDRDGAYRSDVAYLEDPTKIDLGKCTLVQGHVPPGAAVCVLGLYSQEHRGIVANPDWSQPTRLILGDPERVARTLRAQVVTRTLLALFCGVLSVGALAAFVANLSPP
jgi:hypothetical protein